MVNWGDKQNNNLIGCIERGDINPHNLDGAYVYGKQFSTSKALKGTGLQNQGQTSSHNFAKSSGTLYSTGL
jgi:hypothetical protein